MSNIINDKKLVDINLSFLPNPNTGDIARLNSFSVIRRSLELILTMGILEKPFREDLGSSLSGQLFEVVSVDDIPFFESKVRNVIERYEPRVGIRRIDIQPQFNENKLVITLVYYIKETGREDTFIKVMSLSE